MRTNKKTHINAVKEKDKEKVNPIQFLSAKHQRYKKKKKTTPHTY